MLVSMFAVFSSIIWAQNYGLQINNVNVTDKNCNDLSVIEGVKGKVKYTPATKTQDFFCISAGASVCQQHIDRKSVV